MTTIKMRLIGSGIIISLVGIAVIGLWLYGPQKADSQGSAFSLRIESSDGSDTVTATSTNGGIINFTAGTTATTSMLILYTGRAETVALNVRFAGPSGASLHLSCQFTDGGLGSDTTKWDWYDGECPVSEAGNSINTVAVVAGSASTTNFSTSFLPSASSTVRIAHNMAGSGVLKHATTTKHFELSHITSIYIRINAQVVGNSGNVWMYATLKEPL